MLGSTVGISAGPHPIGIIGIAPNYGHVVIVHLKQLPSLRPGVVPITIKCDIAYGVIVEGLAVIGCQQIAPCPGLPNEKTGHWSSLMWEIAEYYPCDSITYGSGQDAEWSAVFYIKMPL